MKRRIAIILLFLVLGAIVNVAVAWGLAVSWPPLQSLRAAAPSVSQHLPPWAVGFGDQEVLDANWIARHIPSTYSLDQGHKRIGRMGIDIERFRAEADDPTLDADFILAEHVMAGWPMRSHSGGRVESQQFDFEFRNVSFSFRRIDALLVADSGWQRVLPLRPIWPGFIINTLFYALLLWLLLIAPFTARRALRRKRRLCEKCAYPVGVSPVCTECGAAVRSSVVRSSRLPGRE